MPAQNPRPNLPGPLSVQAASVLNCRAAKPHPLCCGPTRIILPFGGLASSIPEEVHPGRVPTIALLAASVGTALLTFVVLRVVLW
jgi:hypothetical protein